jgi:hypothetical protein
MEMAWSLLLFNPSQIINEGIRWNSFFGLVWILTDKTINEAALRRTAVCGNTNNGKYEFALAI